MERYDGYINTVIGHGLRSHDPFTAYRYSGKGDWLVDWREADSLYTYNGIAQKIIRIPAEDALSKGFFLKADGVAVEANDAVHSILEDLAASKQLATALYWDRLYGGSAMLMLIDDGRTLEEPVDENHIRHIERLDVFSPEDISFTNEYLNGNPFDPNFGMPEWYNIIGLNGGSFLVHKDRLLIFAGDAISNQRRRMRNGWGGTVLERVRSHIMQYGTGLELSLMALGRLSQGILRLDGLTSQMQSDFGEEAVRRRLHLIDMARHLMNTIAIDTADEYDQKNLSLAGIKDVVEEFQTALAAATDIPATILFGKSPDGENATGESDFENYYNMVGRIQQRALRPNLLRLIELIGAGSDYNLHLPEEYTIEFKPLWNLSDKEQAEVEKLKADTSAAKANAAKTYTELGALDAAEIRDTLAEKTDYKLDRALDKPLLRDVS